MRAIYKIMDGVEREQREGNFSSSLIVTLERGGHPIKLTGSRINASSHNMNFLPARCDGSTLLNIQRGDKGMNGCQPLLLKQTSMCCVGAVCLPSVVWTLENGRSASLFGLCSIWAVLSWELGSGLGKAHFIWFAKETYFINGFLYSGCDTGLREQPCLAQVVVMLFTWGASALQI